MWKRLLALAVLFVSLAAGVFLAYLPKLTGQFIVRALQKGDFFDVKIMESRVATGQAEFQEISFSKKINGETWNAKISGAKISYHLRSLLAGQAQKVHIDSLEIKLLEPSAVSLKKNSISPSSIFP